MMIINSSSSSYRSIHATAIRAAAPAYKSPFTVLRRHGVKLIASIMLFIILFTSFLLMGINATGTVTEGAVAGEQTVVVSSGDTLWSIASRHSEGKKETGYIVYLIKNRNNLDSVTIVPGQKLIIPKF